MWVLKNPKTSSSDLFTDLLNHLYLNQNSTYSCSQKFLIKSRYLEIPKFQVQICYSSLSHVNRLQEIQKIRIDSKVSFQYFDINHIQIEASLILPMMELIPFICLIAPNWWIEEDQFHTKVGLTAVKLNGHKSPVQKSFLPIKVKEFWLEIRICECLYFEIQKASDTFRRLM